MPSRRYYANNAPQQTLSSQITNSATSLTVTSFTGWPTQFPFFATLELGTANEEIISITAITGGTATIVRAQDGSAAITHLAGATLDFTVVRQDFDEANAHTSASAGVHGISGSVVGTNDAQMLSNKTLASPTVTGTSAGQNETLSGTLAVTGTTTLTGRLTANGGVVDMVATNQAAVTSPVTGMVVYFTAPTGSNAQAGPYFYDGANWNAIGRGVPIVAQLRQTVSQSIVNGPSPYTPLTWQTADYDTGNGLSAGVWTSPVTGVFRISGSAEFPANATGRRIAKLVVGGTDINGSQHEETANATSNTSVVIPPIRVAVTSGQTVALAVYQSSGASMSMVATAPNFSYLLIEQVPSGS